MNDPRAVVEHLYVHIPFCPKICPYCSFYKEASDRNKTQAFLDAVLDEAARHSAILRPKTVFFGGGTPSALSTSQLTFLLKELHSRIDLSQVAEWTLEMNPATVSGEKAEALRALGVTRISMGVQSWDDALLAILGRVHTANQARRSYAILREAGIPSVNLDLIFGIPGQTLAQWEDSLRETVRLKPDHISAYCLTYEEDTEFFRQRQQGRLGPDEERDARFFETAMAVLESSGYRQYEISNYAPDGGECGHNLAYWTGRDYAGLGPSAFSTIGGRRWKNVSNTAEYVASIQSGRDASDFCELLTDRTRLVERIAFSLRTRLGIEDAAVGEWRRQLEKMQEEGLVRQQEEAWVLTRRGLLVADEIAEIFV